MKPPVQILVEDGRSSVTYFPDYIPPGRADALLRWSLDHIPWKSETYNFGGKVVEARRKSAAFGTDPDLATYTYSGVTRTADRMPSALRTLPPMDHNFVLANLYPDGRAAIGAHADDEPELGPTPLIACLSLGAARRLVFTDKKTGKRTHEVVLEHGSFLVMSGETQQHFKHAIPAQPSIKLPRVSFTYRTLKATS